MDTTTYYSSTTATSTTAGGVAGYVKADYVEQGLSGTPIEQDSYTYFSHTDANGNTIFPTASYTVYRNTNGTGAETTTYAYTYFTGANGIQSMTTTLPVVSNAENGPGTADVTTTVYDTYGNPVWSKDADGFITYNAYDTATGGLIKTIQDVDTTKTSEFANLPSGWTTPAGGGLNLVTTYQVDDLGRATQVTDPNGNVTLIVYDDADHEVRMYAGWNFSTHTATGPTTVEREDLANGYTETITMSATPHLNGDNLPDGTEAISDIQSLSRDITNTAGQVIETDDYFNLSGITYSTAVHLGTLNVNYYATTYAYDVDGRQYQTVDADGTISDNVYDALSRVVATYVGTDDATSDGNAFNGTNAGSGNNMTLVSSDVYDNGGVGDGNLTQTTMYPGGSAANQVTDYLYDWQDRGIADKTGVQTTETGNTSFITVNTLDNLGEVTAQFTFTADGIPLSDFASGVTTTTSGGHTIASVDASALRFYTTSSYDEQGGDYQDSTYSVDPTTGYISSDAIVSNTWYDHRGDVIEMQTSGGPASKMVYDGAGRETIAYTTDGGAVNNSGTPLTSWADANTVANDIVLEQGEYLYDADGDVLMTTDRQRFHDDSDTDTGALGTNATGILARVSYTLSYYDALNRDVADVNVGTNGGVTDDSQGGLDLTTDANSDGIPDVLQGSVPTRSDDVLVTSYTYNAAGELDTVTDPKGIESKTYYDALGETLFTVAAWDGSYDPTTGALPSSDDANQTTAYTYDGDGHTLTMTAVMPSGEDSQTTQYVYGVTTSGGSTINSNDLLALVEYPDPTTGAASTDASNQNSFTYDALGETLTKTDQNGTTHTYTYDVLGRQTSDAVTLAAGNPENIDDSVLRIETAYNDQGLADTVTSYDAATGGDIVNQVQDVYNGLGQLIQQYQSTSGAVDTGTTPSVQYAYDTLANGSRLTSMTYPNGTVLTYSYGDSGSLNDVISRLDSLIDASTTVESYQYMGLSTVVIEATPEDGIDLTYVKQTGEANGDAGDQYIGLDRFGRVVDQRWIDSSGVDQDRYLYTYDADGNVTEKANALYSYLSEAYIYDNLNRLTSTIRDPDGTPIVYQSFGLDSIGNIDNITTSGTTTDNTTNDQNELTGVGSNTLAYDNNGNTITDDQGHTLIYDAWNRLIEVKDGSTVLETFTYNAMGQQITQTPGGGTATELYYSSQDQVIEERQSGYATAQYVWSAVYVNAMVLRDRDADDSGDGTMEERVYATQDANFNVTALVTYNPGTTTWGVSERLVYDAYGNFTVHAANWDATTDYLAWNYTFQGMRWDSITGFNYTMSRVYEASTGRFLTVDPSGLSGMNNYWTFEDNPIDGEDPTGLATITVQDVSGASFFSHWLTEAVTPLKLSEQRFLTPLRAIRKSKASPTSY